MTATEYATRVAAPSPAPREHTLALLYGSPVHDRVAGMLGVPTFAGRRGGPHRENEIAARLAKLPSDWSVHSAVPAGVEHLVIGPAGVFVICTAHHPRGRLTVRGDRIRVAGRRPRHVPDARRNTAQVAGLLRAAAGVDVPVFGVVALMGAPDGVRIKRAPADVTVVTARTLTAFMHSRTTVLPIESVRHLNDVAARRTTWDPAG